jgi:protein TonB
LLFLVIGLLGLKSPEFITRHSAPVADAAPVELEPPPEEQQGQAEPQPQEEHVIQKEALVERPRVATVVAANPAAVAFAVPVEGPVIFVPAQFAPPPPREPPLSPPANPPKVTAFRRSSTDGGSYPDPDYPRLAQERRQHGSVTLYLVVNSNGIPTTVEVKDSSGYPLLDKAALTGVKNRWRFPPGEVRYHTVQVIYKPYR